MGRKYPKPSLQPPFPNKPFMPPNTFVSILLLEGFASASLQMLCLRQSVEYAGSSILNTSIVVTVFLVALSLGYLSGGRVSGGSYMAQLSGNLLKSATMLAVLFSGPFVSGFYEVIGLAGAHPLVDLAAFSILVMAPIVYMLGQTVPILINETKAGATKSQAAGDTTAISTAGNVLGCLITPLVIMYYLGTGWAVALNAFALLACYLLLLHASGKLKKLMRVHYAASALVLVAVTLVLNPFFHSTAYVASTAYSNIAVIKSGDWDYLVVNGSSASRINSQGEGHDYIEAMKQQILEMHEQRGANRVLVLGAGGFTLTAGSELSGLDVTFVDVDHALKSVSETHFLKKSIQGRFVVSDARVFLKEDFGGWDVIVVDVYSHQTQIPTHLLSEEFFHLVKSRVKPGGAVLLNVVGDPQFRSIYQQRVFGTIQGALGPCLSSSLHGLLNPSSNLLFTCFSMGVGEPYDDSNTQAGVDSGR